MQWYEATSKKLEAGHRYSHQELIKLLKNNYPQMRDSSYHWAVCGMLKSGNLTKVARNVYVVQNEREKPMYRPAYSDLAAKLISQVSDKYPSVRFTVFETALMNDFLNHLVALNTVFIQAEKDVSIFVFRHLRELGYAHLLYKPKKQTMPCTGKGLHCCDRYDFRSTVICICAARNLSGENAGGYVLR